MIRVPNAVLIRREMREFRYLAASNHPYVDNSQLRFESAFIFHNSFKVSLGSELKAGFMSKERVLIVGFDGAPHNLITRLIQEKKMPNLEALAAKGVQGPLKSTLPPQSLPAWPSFASGMNPGKHGVYGFFKREAGKYSIRPCSSEDIRGMTIWDYLTSIGRTTILVNVPLTHPPYQIGGAMVSGSPSPPGPPDADELECFPESLAEELRAVAPRYKVEPHWEWRIKEDKLLEIIYGVLEQRTKATLHLLKNKPWELFIVVFTCSDRIEHLFWRYLDPHHPACTPEGRRLYGTAIDDFYHALDDTLGSMLKVVGDSTTTIVLSDHGHGSQVAHVGVNQLLADIGVLRYNVMQHFGLTKDSLQDRLKSLGLLRLAKKIIPKGVRSAIPLGFDASKSTAYCDCFGAININLKGRDPQGFVEKEDYGRVRDELVQSLLNYKSPTGEPLIEKIYKAEEIYWGDRLNSAPDILAIFRDGYGPRTWNPNGQVIQAIDSSQFDLSRPIVECGGHHWFSTMDGIFFAHGGTIKQDEKIDGAQLIDIAPTVLHLLSIPIPSNMDGKVLPIFEPGSEPSSRAIQYADAISPVEAKESPWSADEEKAVMKRLADLGYMG